MLEEMLEPSVCQGFVEFGEFRTWYRLTGELDAGDKPPVVVLHGGPGATHDYLLAFAELAAQRRPVVHYDQIGNGRSTRVPGVGEDFWTIEFFAAELANLLTELGVAGSYHLLGQAWGGVLGAEHAVTQPAGLRSLILADTPSSMELYSAELTRLRDQLPADVEKTLRQHEEAGTTDTEEYRQAMRAFYERHLCRLNPRPPELLRTFSFLEEESTVYNAMKGPDEFRVIGTLRDWSIIDRLDRIQVPTLLISGSYDEVTPSTMLPYHTGLADVRWEILANSSHLPHIEESKRCLDVVAKFLDEQDARCVPVRVDDHVLVDRSS